jgi:hypothetical protein
MSFSLRRKTKNKGIYLDEFIQISRFRNDITAAGGGVFCFALHLWERGRPSAGHCDQGQGRLPSALALQHDVVEDHQPKVFLSSDTSAGMQDVTQPLEGRLSFDHSGRRCRGPLAGLDRHVQSFLQKHSRWFRQRKLLDLVETLDARKDIPGLISLLLLDLLVLDTPYYGLHFRDHLQRALVLERAWIGMEEEVLEEKRVFQEPLERLGQRDGETSFAFVHGDFLELSEILADLDPFCGVLLLGLLFSIRRQRIIDLLESSLQVEDKLGIAVEELRLGKVSRIV